METNESKAKIREPLFHITKRSAMPWQKAWLIRLAAIAAALIFCGILSMILLGANPLEFYSALIKGSLGSKRKIWKLARDTAVLLCIALAVTPAFRMKFWNIGAEGQVLVGALATAACMFYFGGKVPDFVLILIMLAAALVAGMIWSGIPAIFRAQFGTNETLFTLMMNYVATCLVSYFLIIWTPNGSSSLGVLPHGHLPDLINEYMLIIILALLLTAGLYVYLNYSKHGYEISVVGESSKTACYIGIDVKKVIIRTMIISGALCGFAGFLIVGGLDHSVTTETAGGQGFTAIMVSWLAKFNPLVMIVTSLFVTFLSQGAAQVSQNFDISPAFPDMITGIILFFIIGCEFFIDYKINFRSRKHGGDNNG